MHPPSVPPTQSTPSSWGHCRIINIKLGRVGGHASARSIELFARSRGIPVWCGGMLESGIGRAHSIAMSTLPGDVSASRRYWTEDVIEPEVTVSSDGTIEARASAGIGYEVNASRLEKLTVRREDIRLMNGEDSPILEAA